MNAACRDARATFSELYDGELPPVEEAAAREHLASCPRCRTVWDRYSASLLALRAEAPPVPARLAPATRTALRAWVSPDRRPPRAALAVVAAAGLLAAVSALSALLARPHRAPGVPGTPVGCVEPLFALWGVDAAGFRSPLPTAVPERTLEVGGGRIALPAVLVSRGPYRTETALARRAGGTVCVPLRAPYGEVLVLSVAGGAPGDRGREPRATVDSTRVSYARVDWQREERRWMLEGRAPVERLLTLASELGAPGARAAAGRGDRGAGAPAETRPAAGARDLRERVRYEADFSRPLGTRSRGMLYLCSRR